MSLFLVFLLGISFLAGESFGSKCDVYHKVASGDNLTKVASKYGISTDDLLKANPQLKKGKQLQVGQRLCIPKRSVVKGDKVEKAKTEPKESGKKEVVYVHYKVKKGDSLDSVAKRFGVSPEEIKAANKLKSDKLKVGQSIKIPVPKDRSVAKSGEVEKAKTEPKENGRRGVVYVHYKVKKGDSLDSVAKRFGVSPEEIKAANKLKSDKLKVGQSIKIPVPKKAFEVSYVERAHPSTERPNISLSFLPVEGERLEVPNGLDIYASCGEEVKAVESGTVIYSGDDLSPYGNMIIVKHEGFLSVYAYNMQNLVKRGDEVSKGDVIAKVGLKPGSGRCALHFEVRTKDGAVLNPLEYLAKR